MPDDMDRVQERVALHLERTIEAHRPRDQPGRLECEDCDQPIPEARRAAYPAARRCVACQQRVEAGR